MSDRGKLLTNVQGVDMGYFNRILGILVLSFIFLAQNALAAPNPKATSRMYGAGAPFTISDLPPGQLRSRLESLPPTARAKAMHWLHSFSFPSEDLNVIHVDEDGGVYYVDTERPQGLEEQAPTAEAVIASEALTVTDIFLLHSRPGASRVVYLDFDGAVISGKQWNSSYGVSSWTARAFDTNSSPASFGADELARIHEIWHRVAEDLSAFDIDVTTQHPGTFGPNTGWILITHSESGSATPLPSANAGGVAYINVWGGSSYTNYQPAFVYYNNLGNGNPTYLAEACSHEFGHNLGLSHDGTTAGVTYYSGHGAGYVSWAPIMGNSYSNNVTQWSKGEYPNANQVQDDVAIITTKLTLRGDDHANVIGAQATPLQMDSTGLVVVTNPQTDPGNLSPANKGVLESRTDVDVFAFNTGGGVVNLKVNPAWDAFYRTAKRGANVDVGMTLSNSSGTPIASNNPTEDTFASLALTLEAGVYYLAIQGVGHALNYSDYSSVGEYFISGTIPPSVGDTFAPTPNPMQFSSAPTALGTDKISMSSVAAMDEGGVVEYQFHCTGISASCVDSPWQASSSYTATGLSPSSTYQFQTRARDLSGNVTQWSASASATTDPMPIVDTTPPSVPTNLLASGLAQTQVTLSWNPSTDNVSVTGYDLYRNGTKIMTVSGTTYTNTGLVGGTNYTYTVAARDGAGNVSAQSTGVSVTTPPASLSISGVLVSTKTGTTATVTATTNKLATVVVKYGTSASTLNLTASGQAILVTNHAVNLTGLKPKSRYYYQVVATSSTGETAASAILNFRTGSR